jgi:ubiquinol-cytochrome c reductase iron-sulfur subunit
MKWETATTRKAKRRNRRPTPATAVPRGCRNNAGAPSIVKRKGCQMANEIEMEQSVTRRDFLYVATGTMAVVGAAAFAWPFIDSMNPSASVRSLASVEVPVSAIAHGQRVTVVWRGRPVFIDRRTQSQIEAAIADDDADLIDPQRDSDRVQDPEWLIVVGVCTHLGCVPLGQREGDPKGDWGGWFCPCHGSQYDTSGRVRRGPAPRNLDVPPYNLFENEMVIVG